MDGLQDMSNLKLQFNYSKEKDIWCLLNKGRSSNNSSRATRVYSELTSIYGDNPSEEETSEFIESFLVKENIEIEKRLEKFQKKFELISKEYIDIAERIFGALTQNEVIVYGTINSRCPYNIQKSYFYIALEREESNAIILHELWHFYTWNTFGKEEQEKLGKVKYNYIKEALTVLLNVECSHLLPKNYLDKGYPQHQELRSLILKWWEANPNIKSIWKKSCDYYDQANI